MSSPRLVYPLAMPLALLVPLAACGESGGTQCACGDPSVTVDLPPSRADVVTAITLSGAGCPGVVPSCTQPVDAGCAQYSFRGTAVGSCDVDLQFASAPADFNATIALRALPCCPGVYAYPAGSDVIEVPETSADAGQPG
jgi:hypothetical protein